ncbi:hypothetical protein PVAND_017158 [Polypedilum vanderplanki]|uniref:MD-2-related lipid-recognition domain-containing protein n=1 Tax=Polypedilum vanderplanki TaxID=319348 RepID=A0A9J6BIA2_POLVA|nr:hypothetical protein PVAND_017158 [Polypedilum vanderplanki]
MKFFKIILVFYFSISSFTFGDVNFKTITCKSDNVLNSIQECSISSKGSLNIAGKFLKTLENPVVDFKISKNESSKYKLIVQNKLEWCAFVSVKGNYEMISTSMLKTSFATLFYDCPYFGKYEVIDFTMPKKMDVILSGILAEGNYKLELYIYENNSTIVDLEMTFEITSLLSDIFGE